MTYNAQPSKSPFGHPQVHANASGVEEYNGGETYALKIPIDYSIADATALYTILYRSRLVAAFWEVTTTFAGGSSSAVGLSSSQSAFTTKGMLHGGSGGDAAATLVAAAQPFRGTQGTAFTAAPFIAILDVGATVRFDRVTSAFTSGVGFVHLEFRVVG